MQIDFFFNGNTARQFGLQQLDHDAQMATLSPSFRIYYHLRPFIPLLLRQFLQRTRPQEVEPRWYVPTDYMQGLAASLATDSSEIPLLAPWPDEKSIAAVLTHDVETAEGMQKIESLAAIEEELGFRSSWNIVPYKYPVDHGLLRDLASRGFEIGVHGYNHDGKLFLSERIFKTRAVAINQALKAFDAVGFRAPMVHRNLHWLQHLDIEYDASYFDIDPYQAMPGGVGSVWPFVAGKFVEMPYTMPQDHTLFIVRQATTTAIWEKKLEFLIKHQGMALLLTHPDYMTSTRLDLYRDFLVRLRDFKDYWHALPAQVAAWWKARSESWIEVGNDGNAIVCGPAAKRASIANLLIEGKDFSLFNPKKAAV